MGSAPALSLPIIHFSEEGLKSDDVWPALKEFGCFEAVYDGVAPKLHEAIASLVEDLFDLPPETKCKNTSTKPSFGHMQTAHSPLYEALGIDHATRFQSTQNFTCLMWPEERSNSCESLPSYAVRASVLEKMVKKMVFESLGIENYYDSHAECIYYLLKFMKYQGTMANDDTKLGLIPHTDKSFCTILNQINQVHGLEVETKDDEWIRVTPSMPSPSSFIYMVGDGCHAWSNGGLNCPIHGVTMSGKEARYSSALFSFSKEMIQCPKELVKTHNFLSHLIRWV